MRRMSAAVRQGGVGAIGFSAGRRRSTAAAVNTAGAAIRRKAEAKIVAVGEPGHEGAHGLHRRQGEQSTSTP